MVEGGLGGDWDWDGENFSDRIGAEEAFDQCVFLHGCILCVSFIKFLLQLVPFILSCILFSLVYEAF